jgi:A/G-specific adenine glycosylase
MNCREAMSNSDLREQRFRVQLLAWYDRHARDLPWRESSDPYRVWVSEIMLQQTRVAAVIAHYHEFLRRFPTVEKLARAREASVLAAWSGLGYYRRARMLHAGAKVVARRGSFPATVEELRELPGVGRYTAAAIASIAFGKCVAVVDGNVERVLQRISGRRMGDADFWIAAQELLDRGRPGDFNQAMMELGAVVCTPRGPRCLGCPVVESCATRGELAGASKLARQRKRKIHYALDFREGAVFLVRRAREARLMAGMWELPEVAGPTGAKAPPTEAGKIAALKALCHSKAEGLPVDLAEGLDRRRSGNSSEACFTLKHSITVTDYTVRVWRMPAPWEHRGEWVAVGRLGRIALTGLARKILRKAGIVAVPGPGGQ